MGKRTAYLGFMADPPLIGLDPQPAWSPRPYINSFDKDGYLEALGASFDRAELQAEIDEDYQILREAYEEDRIEDICPEPDVIHKITVGDDGTIEVIHENPRYIITSYHISDVYEAFGMKMPTTQA